MTSLTWTKDDEIFFDENLINKAVNYSIIEAQDILASFASDAANFASQLSVAFGDDYNINQSETIRQDWVIGNWSNLPDIELLSGESINGANSAYSIDTNKIYLSAEYVEQNIDNISAIAESIVEEIGHEIDYQINASDAVGDEGRIFLALAANEPLPEDWLQQLRAEDDIDFINLDGQIVQIEKASVSDSGGFEGSQQTIQLESNGGGKATFRYEHFFIPDNFIIRYEGQNILETGFVGGSQTGTVQIPEGDSDQLEVIVATNDSGTAWNYDVTTDTCADTGDFLIELANGEFEDTDDDGDCEGSGTVFLGRKSGTSRLLRIEGADVEFDEKELRVLDGTVFSLIGNVSEPLFTGNFVLDFSSGTTKSLTDVREANQFKFGDLVDIDFKSLNVQREKIALTGDFTLPLDLGEVEVKLDGTPNSLLIDNNGATLGGGKISFPRQEFRFLEEAVPPGLFNVDAKNLSIEYVAANDQLKFQGQLTLKDPITKNESGNFALGNTEIVFDFAGNNFIGIQNGKVDVVGSASVKNIKLPGGWGLNELGVSIDTTKQEIKGKTRISFPFPARSPIPPQSDPNFGLELGFLLPPPNLRIDSVSADVDNLNIPIGATGFFFQRVAGSVSNISKEDPIRFGGGIGFSYGPVVTIDIPDLAQDILGLPPSVDAAAINVKLNVDSDFDSSIAGSGEVSIVSPEILKIAGQAEYNWDKDFAKGSGSLNVIGGLVSGTANGRLDIDRGNFDGSGSVSVKIPDVSLFGFLRDKTLGSANAQIQYRDDSTTSNDFVNAWGEINLGTINLPLFGQINLGVVDVGIRYRYLEGDVDLLGNQLPLIGSWNVASDSEWVLIGADWEIASNNVSLRVIDPDGNVYEESEFADNGIAIVDDLTDSKTRTIVIGRPKAGIWDIEVVDETGLGEVNYSAFGATDAPEVTLLTPDTDITGVANITFEAFDSDSNAKISLFYDDDNADFDGAFITELTETDGLGNFQWDTQGIATGEYFIYAMAMDDEGVPVFSNYSLGKVIVSEEADLSVIQTASTDSIGSGETFTYTVKVTNNGSADSQGVTLVETLPEEVTFVSASLTPSEQVDNVVTFDLGNLADGESTTVDIVVTSPTIPGTITSDAFVSSNTFDPDATNDVDILTTTVVETPPALPDLTVTRTDSQDSVALGETFSYTLDVTNNGSGDATGIFLSESLPSGFRVISATAETGSQTARNFVDLIELQLDAGERATIDIDAQILGSSLDSVLRLFNSAGTQVAVSDDTAAPGESFTLDSYIDFTASATDTYYVGVSNFSNFNYNPFVDGSGNPGSSSGSYDIEIIVGSGAATQGTLPEPNNTIPEAVDSGLSSATPGTFIASGFIDSRNTNNPVNIGSNGVTANLGNLSSGETASVNLTVEPFLAGDLVSTTGVTSNQTDANPTDNELINIKTVSPVIPASADLELTQTVSNTNPEVGDQITITLTLTNNGPGVASRINVTDILPPQLSFVSASTLQGTYNSNTGIWDVGNLRDNLSRSLTIVANVEAGGTLINTAEVTAVSEADPDSVPNNNNPNEDDQDTVTITAISTNTPPIAEADKTVTVDEDASPTPLNIAAPTDVDGDPLTITVNTIPDPVQGEVRLADNTPISTNQVLTAEELQNLVFVPAPNANGDAGEFSYEVSDGIDGTDTQTVSLEITPINDPPLVQNDTATTEENTPITLLANDLLANDSDIESDPLSLIAVGNAINGVVVLDGNGDAVFTPDLDFSGDASFEYTVSDGTDSAIATVDITVNADSGINEIVGTAGRDNLTGTEQSDRITGLQSRDTITGGGGDDIFSYTGLVDAGDIITDLEVGSDKIDLVGVLNSVGFAGIDPIAEGYVGFRASRGVDTILTIDPDGATGSGSARSFILVQGVTSAELNNSDNFIFS